MDDQQQHFQKWSQLARKFLGDDFWSDVMSAYPATSSPSSSGGPKADVYHTQNEVIVLVDLPGIEDIHLLDLRIQDDTLYIKGNIPARYANYDATLSERLSGDFERSIPLGATVTRQHSSARYRKGLLEVRLHKMHAPRAQHRIRVQDS
ncbi:Hsp20/alpha crystallin family protein [Polycladomyces sp. WAk]|uniref:Hsp20/alpha crystallin family protein n=1 Tax=Polycladomyces zharkentensis TaxID=2807616 RepID=A0ABS2WN85_9BACL|nr:Hsp20/alpha crystallin family protein [Polycladomyces sp. WAk]MBN2911042.1 Hsp20/alpha crystallin family protein [Polycladomyces sp. WAk]